MPLENTLQSLGPATAVSPIQPDDCPECEGPVRTEEHETVCTDCGLIIDEDQIDHGPDWRSFDSDPNSKERAAPVMPNRRHDKGLGTEISRNQDAPGQALSAEKRRQLARLRTQNARAQFSSKRERNQAQAFTDISRMASALGLPEYVMEQACVLFKTAQSEDLLQGRCIEGFSTATLYAAARINQTPRTIDEFAHVSKVECGRIRGCYSALNRELSLPVPPARPIEFLPQLISAVDAPTPVEQTATELLEAMADDNAGQGRDPAGVAAGAIYIAAEAEDMRYGYLTQKELADEAGVVSVTVRAGFRLAEEYITDI